MAFNEHSALMCSVLSWGGLGLGKFKGPQLQFQLPLPVPSQPPLHGLGQPLDSSTSALPSVPRVSAS